jgi:hypothetical protein
MSATPHVIESASDFNSKAQPVYLTASLAETTRFTVAGG